ncbi:hypothetical protein SAMN05216490_0434 [Mucilaginibacter mallensis]|uniref:Uncharacterized protein n=1 Tax=Mucilaginibacter mallensis TaxID=652787 RepID=A0A1H1NZM3_MUCMA|nr:hypothetical protein [Mucilaginibacter mallensis]SDS04412.1 hypothetical protein SAMN05216490_0434 [Mucilaginibacter mallensis]
MEISSQISEKTNHDTNELIERILLIMTREKYDITGIKTDSVKFDNAYGGRHEQIRRFDSGIFKIEDCGNYRVVDLNYTHLDSLDIVIICIISTLYIVAGICLNNSIFLMGVPFIVYATFKYYNLKRIAKEILTEIVN